MTRNPDRFIEALCEEALDSTAANHPYLQALSTGQLPDFQRALQDFAVQYGCYSSKFTDYVSAVIENLREPEHKTVLLANLAEEQGAVDGVELAPEVLKTVVGEPHTRLYQRFQRALGVDESISHADRRDDVGSVWSEQFLRLCQTNENVGIGAIGVGTELIVSRIYSQILAGLKSHSQLSEPEHVFFDLHSHCDEVHAEEILLIARDQAQDSAAREEIAQGARTAIALRTTFWDQMLARAECHPAANASDISAQAAILAH